MFNFKLPSEQLWDRTVKFTNSYDIGGGLA